MRTALRAALALGLLIGFYLVILAVVGGDIGLLALWASLPVPPGEGLPPAMPAVIVSSVPMLLAAFYGVFAVSRSNAPLPDSVLVGREQAPELWEAVERLAQEVGTRPPSQIRLIGDANAMVFEESYLLGLMKGRTRVLYVGAPLLVGLDADELRAVLCHELGHYANNHTRLAALVYRGSASLQGTLDRLQAIRSNGGMSFAWILHAPLSQYARLYYRIALAVNRRQELEADAAAARIAGARTTGDALRSVHAIAASWTAFSSQVIAPMRRAGRLPDDPFSAYRAMLDDPYYRDQFDALRAATPKDSDDRHDTHPALATRLKALAALESAADERERDRRLALELIRNREALLRRTSRHTQPPDSERVPWREWLVLVVESRASAPARALKRAVARLLGPAAADAPVAAVLDCLEAGRRDELAEQLDRALGVAAPEDAAGNRGAGGGSGRAADPASDQGEAGPAGRLLGALFSLVGQALVGIGGAVWHLSWTGNSLLTPRDITAEELAALLAAAVRDRREVPRLRLHLAELGVDVNGPVALGEAGQPQRELTVTPKEDAQARRRRRNQLTVFLVVTVGLIAVFGAISGISQIQNQSPPLGDQPLAVPYYSYSAPDNGFYQSLLTYPSLRPIALPTALPLEGLLPRASDTTTITVRGGDTLGAIAQRCDSTVSELQQLNGLGSSTMIYAGQQLKVPALGALIAPASCS
ncbi:MAG TPA: M48 family metalloprotease [Actinocrinis sp.]|uniref:M48 family metalloprotease n=1 Tax=Actinocrinis sp. TaxID=1920516 RepID=UPI002D5A5A31|nr:M48 family metalloprotease [Actinocrinis sp.]HZU57641.1 M48 family metalloprotease [Actinocrinis sp.]